MATGARLAVLLGLLVPLAAGCATSGPIRRAETSRAVAPGSRILLMEPDVTLYELTAAGLLEPKADWTATAQSHIGAALAGTFTARGVDVVPYTAPADESTARAHEQLIKLHERVGGTILAFRYGAALTLPAKGAAFDWTLGETTRTLGEGAGADYALFVYFADSYASSGRVAAMVVLGLLGVGIPGGVQVGFGSLVDLRTGDLVWFNRLVDPAGDLRTPERAQDAVRALLADFPFAP